jgi:hypothetical protein
MTILPIMENSSRHSSSNSSSNDEVQMKMLKRNSLMEDELADFDPSELEDDWGDVFDDDAPADSVDPSVLMPPPADKKSGLPPLPAGVVSSSSAAKNALESMKRRRRTGAQIEKAEKEGPPPPSWHSEAADLPHRQAMIQDM